MAVARTELTPHPGAVAGDAAAREFLHFIVEAGGPNPIFSFVSSVKHTLFQAADFLGHPKVRYEWEHLKNPSDIQQLEVLNLAFAFLTNAAYRYTVELRGGAAPRTVLQVDYTGAPTDVVGEPFTVVIP